MGPRRHRRGDTPVPRASGSTRARFNGATASPPWRPREQRREWERTNRLQWGHGVTAVETRDRTIQRVAGPLASMGPRRHRRGDTMGLSRPSDTVSALQWGHGVTAVETWLFVPESADSNSDCFNGATASPPWRRDAYRCVCHIERASMGPRRHRRGDKSMGFDPEKMKAASMGPRRHRRGDKRIFQVEELVQSDASMGPRRHRRGDHPVRPCIVLPFSLLQWGHGVTAVETSPLQWNSCEPHRASMGPRRHRRGDLRRCSASAGTRALQWGHGVTAVETSCDPSAHSCHLRASMGPRRHRRGDLRHWSVQNKLIKLQWGHGVTAVETRARGARSPP